VTRFIPHTQDTPDINVFDPKQLPPQEPHPPSFTHEGPGFLDQDDLLDIVDAVLYWHPLMAASGTLGRVRAATRLWPSRSWWEAVDDLDDTLTLARSVWRVNDDGDGLELRHSDSVTDATHMTIASAPHAAADHLRRAWAYVYGRRCDQDMAYVEAVRAVEELACPCVLPDTDGKRTLGQVIIALRSDLRARQPKWELILPDKQGSPRDVGPLAEMMSLLWEGEVSRHGGSTKSRRQTPAEAQAAVHLAVAIVQLLTMGLLRKKNDQGP
jgi:hypothetical protein